MAIARDARHHRQKTTRQQQIEQRRIRASAASHQTQRRIHRLGLDQITVHARQPHRGNARCNQGGDKLLVHAPREHFQHGIHGLGRGDAQPVDETAFHAALGEKARHLLAAAMHHGDLDAAPRLLRDLRGQVRAQIRCIQQRAAQFDQRLHSRPSVSPSPSIKFMFCTACPAAPFVRLSMALTTTARPEAASTVTPISQKLVCLTPRRSGTRPG